MELESTDGGANLKIRHDRNRNRHRGIKICIGVTAVVIGIILLIVILAFTVFKPKRPVTVIDSVSVQDLSVSLDLARVGVRINVTLDVDISIKNPNKVGFKYSQSSALLNYRDRLVGEAPIQAGKISSDHTAPMNLTLTLMADRILSDSHLISDVMDGALPLNTFVKLSGKVTVLNVFKIRVHSSSSCNFTVFIANRTVGNQECKYKTKL